MSAGIDLDALAERLGQRLGRGKLRPTEMARAAGVPYRTWAKWVSGETAPSSVAQRALYLLERVPPEELEALISPERRRARESGDSC